MNRVRFEQYRSSWTKPSFSAIAFHLYGFLINDEGGLSKMKDVICGFVDHAYGMFRGSNYSARIFSISVADLSVKSYVA